MGEATYRSPGIWQDAAPMWLPPLPDPVTLSYIGACAAVVGVIAKAVTFRWMRRWPQARTATVMVLGLLGGIYGAVRWVRAMLGDETVDGSFELLSGNIDPIGLLLGISGLSSLVMSGVALYVRFIKRRPIN